ncbi:MAG TPA: hypothetical protein VGN48_06405 [Pedococcus sp.]|jgi:hypothetical protein|nr:hypothetical protein [Pedococcus sp.]
MVEHTEQRQDSDVVIAVRNFIQDASDGSVRVFVGTLEQSGKAIPSGAKVQGSVRLPNPGGGSVRQDSFVVVGGDTNTSHHGFDFAVKDGAFSVTSRGTRSLVITYGPGHWIAFCPVHGSFEPSM